jgi:hypothetical protein
MTAVVASHHAGLWHSRSDHSIHIPNMNMSGLVSSYDSSPRTSTLPPTSRGYQATTSHMDINMPLFSTHSMPTSMPYQSGAFAFDALSVNPYNMQQAYPVSYQQAIPHAATYAGATNIQQLPTARDIPNGFSMERTPPVKAESSSPVQSSSMYNEASYSGDFKRANSKSEDGSNNNFATDVDTLMRAIQAKQKPVPTQQQRPQPPKVRQISHDVPLVTRDSLSGQEEEVAKSGQKQKKRYQCSMPDCHKSFYQKTHLEIHTRAHTGVKPFVSTSFSPPSILLTQSQLCKEPSCGQRFSQLGNLKVRLLRLFLNSQTNYYRHTSDGTQESGHTTVTFVARRLPNAATFVPTRLSINKLSRSLADWMTAESSSPSLVISRSVKRNPILGQAS